VHLVCILKQCEANDINYYYLSSTCLYYRDGRINPSIIRCI